MQNTEAPATMTLRIIRASRQSPVSTSHEVQVADRAEAHQHLGFYRDDTDSITAFLTDADGRWAGSGIAGSGRHLSDWA